MREPLLSPVLSRSRFSGRKERELPEYPPSFAPAPPCFPTACGGTECSSGVRMQVSIAPFLAVYGFFSSIPICCCEHAMLLDHLGVLNQ